MTRLIPALPILGILQPSFEVININQLWQYTTGLTARGTLRKHLPALLCTAAASAPVLRAALDTTI